MATTGVFSSRITLSVLGISALTIFTLQWAVAQTDPNSFNRLMRPHSERNAAPESDGIHDPASFGTAMLQPPKEAFESLPKSASGNFVNWSRALEDGAVAPRYDINDPNVPPVVLDLNIVREVKGSMPNVVYPHKQHTQWLDCANCHPAIFIPQKGANQISMASILLGQNCGVCHGKVAFPVSECRRCHSQSKDTAAAQSANTQ
jgi:c(7)-type cytochrome triheme protein